MISLLKGFFCAFCKVLTSIHKQCIFIIFKNADLIFMMLFSVIVLFQLLEMKKSSILRYRKAVNILVVPPVMLLSTAHLYSEYTDSCSDSCFSAISQMSAKSDPA